MNEKDLHWLVGFIEGEGTFTINAIMKDTSISFHPVFGISLAEKDKQTIFLIKKLLGFGRIEFKSKKIWRSKGIVNAQNQYKYILSGILPAQKFIEIFNEDLFKTSKKESYLLWKQAIEIIKNYQHLNYAGFIKLCEIRDEMNRRKKRKNYKNKKYMLDHIKDNKSLFSEANIQKRKNKSIWNRLRLMNEIH